MTFKSFLDALWKNIVYVTIALTAVFVLSFSASQFVIPKVVLLTTGASLAALVFVLSQMLGAKFSFSFGKFDLGVFLIGIAYLASALIKTPNPMEAFFSPGTASLAIAGAVIYYLTNQMDERSKNAAKMSVVVSGALLSLGIFFTQTGLFSKIPQLPDFVKDANFNAMGGALPSLIFLGTLTPLALGMVLGNKSWGKKMLSGILMAVIVFGLSVSAIQILPGKTTALRLAPLQTSWEVAVEVVKKTPVFGIGPGNYLTAFNLFRPVSYNSTDLWTARFTTARNFYLTYTAEVGILGLFALAILLSALYRSIRRDIKSKSPDFARLAEKSSIAVLLGLFVFLPGTPLLTAYFFIFLALFSQSEERNRAEFNIHPSFLGIPVFIGIFLLFFNGAKIVSAEALFKKSLDALAKNDAKGTYDLMRETITKNPNMDVYHSSAAQINMALASSIAGKENLTDEDKNAISQLISQAIAEGKATVTLNPQRSGNWEILARTYRSIMPYAQGADEFAIQTFSQAAALDPVNPNLRIALGGTYYALGRYDEAIEAFKLAVLAKPDLANAHYNLAVAYREKKDFDNAVAQINAVLALVEKDSADYNLAKSELENLEKQRPAKTSEGTENLTPPQPAFEPVVSPPIELPQEATPPEGQ